MNISLSALLDSFASPSHMNEGGVLGVMAKLLFRRGVETTHDDG